MSGIFSTVGAISLNKNARKVMSNKPSSNAINIPAIESR